MPDAQTDIKNSSLFVMIGFLIMYFVLLPTKLNDNSNGMVKGLTLGMLFHNFFEGLSIAFSYSGSFKLGVIVTIALVIHKIPEGLSYTSAMLAFLNGRKKTTIYLIIQGVFTWLGAGISVFLSEFKNFHQPIVPIGISITAGIFLYLSGSTLLPCINQKPYKRTSVLFVSGIILYFLLHTISEALS
jgi:zinc transporter ZupT